MLPQTAGNLVSTVDHDFNIGRTSIQTNVGKRCNRRECLAICGTRQQKKTPGETQTARVRCVNTLRSNLT